VSALTLESPAKINLFLSITGRRADGFHDLVSVAAPLAWGDTLAVEAADDFALACDEPAVPLDDSNLILKAARAFRNASGSSIGARFSLTKRIPMGAGLGGGSSNAATALRALNELSGRPLSPSALAAVAAQIGSDCALFLENCPVVMRGRGEAITALQSHAAERVTGRSVLIFKPAFGISTPWAYRQLATQGATAYLPAAETEARLSGWLDSVRPVEDLLFNNMEPPAFRKNPALPILLERLSKTFGVATRMSGSGSACFVLLRADSAVDAMRAVIRDAWGVSAFVHQTRLG
jgi:4-diphosphocytidyl-2-C-methyl-D-erythritol kinase